MANPKPIIAGELQDDVCCLALAGVPVQLLADELGLSRVTVYRAVRERFPFRPRPAKFSEAELADMRRRILARESARSVAARFGVTIGMLSGLVGSVRGMRRAALRSLDRSELRLSLDEREEISRGIEAGLSGAAIARALKRAPSTVTREIGRCGGRRRYRAWRGEELFIEASRRPKVAKLAANPTLRARVSDGLANYWSPEQVSAELRRDFPDDRLMQVSHETIYQSLYVQGRGALRAELKQYLRWKRAARKKRSEGSPEKRGKIPDMVMISDRPAEVADRAVPGHWEGDLIIGRDGKSAIATLVERHSRFVMLAALPTGRTAEAVKDALIDRIQSLPDQLLKSASPEQVELLPKEELWRSITWDQGRELARHADFTVATGVQVYFCDPHSPWQRGSNENTNGLLRQFLPRTSDLSRKSQEELDEIARLLNHRPRQTLKWMKPYEVLNAAIGALTG